MFTVSLMDRVAFRCGVRLRGGGVRGSSPSIQKAVTVRVSPKGLATSGKEKENRNKVDSSVCVCVCSCGGGYVQH